MGNVAFTAYKVSRPAPSISVPQFAVCEDASLFRMGRSGAGYAIWPREALCAVCRVEAKAGSIPTLSHPMRFAKIPLEVIDYEYAIPNFGRPIVVPRLHATLCAP